MAPDAAVLHETKSGLVQAVRCPYLHRDSRLRDGPQRVVIKNWVEELFEDRWMVLMADN